LLTVIIDVIDLLEKKTYYFHTNLRG